MLVPKEMIVERLRARGDFAAVERAERKLSDKVDTESDASVLSELGIDAGALEDESGGQAPAIS